VAVVEMKNKKKQAAEGCADGMCVLPLPAEKMAPAGVVSNQAAETEALPRLLDLGAGKCVPCKAMAPILDEMAVTFAGQLHVEFIDVWENEGISEKYGVRMIPTQIFYDADGNELFRHEGFYARHDMLKKWKELGFEFMEQTQM
jgi:thioredoxin 1